MPITNQNKEKISLGEKPLLDVIRLFFSWQCYPY